MQTKVLFTIFYCFPQGLDSETLSQCDLALAPYTADAGVDCVSTYNPVEAGHILGSYGFEIDRVRTNVTQGDL